MAVSIHRIDLGFNQCYVIRSAGVIAVDAGAPDKEDRFLRGLSEAFVDPKEVRLIVITHGHWDHIGSAREMRHLTGGRIAMHRLDAPSLERSLKPLSPGVTAWGRLLSGMHKPFMPLISIPSAKVDLLLGDEEYPLHTYGIPGKILHTPGHTSGSVSVLLDTGEAFVGDLAMNRFPLRLSPGLPVFAEDMGAVRASWKSLLGQGAKTVYPAHGEPFPADRIRRMLP